MRLIEAIIDANHRAAAGDSGAGIHPADYADELPLVALTCIDPRLNALLPNILGVPEDQFIWLRNAGNIIFDSMSSMTRTLALACAIKGGREIAIIGHTDCRVRETSVLQLTDRFKALGIPRAALPENLTEFFGLFASENQNVMRGVDFVRKSPLIGPKIAVHGLMVDIQTGKLEWIVNGYQALESPQGTSRERVTDSLGTGKYAPFNIGDINSPSVKIGDAASRITVSAPVVDRSSEAVVVPGTTPPPAAAAVSSVNIDHGAHYRVMDAARKIFGPVTGKELEQWIQEGRVDLNALVQKLGYKDWRPLAALVDREELPSIPIPSAVADALRFGLEKLRKR